MIVSFLAGGFIAVEYGWRAVFLIYGLPGVLLALLILFTVPEANPRQPIPADAKSGMISGALALLGDRRLRPVLIGSVVFSTCNAGVGSWMVSFLVRVHHLSLPAAGSVVALAIGVFGTIGSLTIGLLADRLERTRPGGLLLTMAIAGVANGIAGVAAALVSSPLLCIVCFCLWGVTALAFSGPSNAAIAELAPPHLTGVGFSLFAVLCNLIGSGLGPLATGMISDSLQPQFGAASMRQAIATIAALQVFAALAYLTARRRWPSRVALFRASAHYQ